MVKVSLKLLGIVIVIGVGIYIAKHINNNDKVPEILFLQENYFSGENGYGTFVDKEGVVYGFDLRGKDWMSDKDTYHYLIDDASMKENALGKVDFKDLESYYNLIKKASASKNKLISTESTLDVYQGYHKWIAFRYNFLGKIETITLYGNGDTKVVNHDKYVKKVVDPIKEILPVR